MNPSAPFRLQTFIGIALAPSLVWQTCAELFPIVCGSVGAKTLTCLAILAVLICGLITGLQVDLGAFSGDRKF
jgi:hypothetical protein